VGKARARAQAIAELPRTAAPRKAMQHLERNDPESIFPPLSRRLNVNVSVNRKLINNKPYVTIIRSPVN